MLGKFAWLKVITENRKTIFKLVTEAFFGRKEYPKKPSVEVPYAEIPTPEVTTEVSA
jgi:hypothetical protein